MVNLSPIRHAIGDHQGAFELVSQSRLDCSLVACRHSRRPRAGSGPAPSCVPGRLRARPPRRRRVGHRRPTRHHSLSRDAGNLVL